MSWVRIDEEAPYHPKIVTVGIAAFGLFCAGLCYANKFLTDGFIPVGTLSAVFPGERWTILVKLAVRLVEVGLWEKRENGWLIHDYHHYQPTKTEVLADRATAHAAKVAGGARRASTAMRIAGRFATTAPPADHQQAHQQPTSSPLEGVHQQNTSPVSVPVSVTEEEATTLSRSRATTRGPNGFSAESKSILQWLNDKTGKHFQPVAAHLRFIEARLKDHEPWMLRKVVTMKSQEWKDDPKSKVWLRPKTLFSETNFANYVGELPVAATLTES